MLNVLTVLLLVAMLVQFVLGIPISFIQIFLTGGLVTGAIHRWRKDAAKKEWMENNYRHLG